jgi:hypothetical protein
MSNDTLGCILTLTAEDRRTQFEVYDGSLVLIASASGGLELALAAGLYEVRSERGDSRAVEALRLEPGSQVERHVNGRAGPVLLPIPAFLEPAEMVHADAMTQATSCMAKGWRSWGGKAQIVVMLRRAKRTGAIPNIGTHAESLSLLDPARKNVREFNARWTVDEATGYAITRARVTPGCYTLCIENSNGRIEQSVVAVSGRQTIVVAPLFRDGPRLGLATCTMCHTRESWQDLPEEHLLLAEISFSRLRRGRPAVTGAEMLMVREYLDADPLLAIIAVNSLARNHESPEYPDNVMADLIRTLKRTFPQYPDVRMLLQTLDPRLMPVKYPPIFSDTYARAMETLGSHEGASEVVSKGSYAENACAVAFQSGPFLRWPASDIAIAAPSVSLGRATAAVSSMNSFTHSAVESILRHSRRQVITQWLVNAALVLLARIPLIGRTLTGLMSARAAWQTRNIRRLAAEKVIAYGQQVAALKRGSTALTLTRVESSILSKDTGVSASISDGILNNLIGNLGEKMTIGGSSSGSGGTGGRPKIVNNAAIGILVAFAALVGWMMYSANTNSLSVTWDRQIYIFGSVEAIVFTAAGALFGVEVKRQQVSDAEQRAERASERASEALESEKLASVDAQGGRALAAAARGVAAAASQAGPDAGETPDVPGGRGAVTGNAASDAALIALGSIADQLFPPT